MKLMNFIVDKEFFIIHSYSEIDISIPETDEEIEALEE